MSTGRSMNALMLRGTRKLELVEVPVPVITSPDDVLIRVRAAGICESDLHGYTDASGRRTLPLIMGHEAAGEVVSTGAQAHSFPVGTRVAIQPVFSCGHCARCRDERRNLCMQRSMMGMNAPGAFAPFVIWPARNLFHIPATLSLEEAVLTEPLANVIRAVRQAPSISGATILVIGAGCMGLLTVAVLRYAGVERIVVSDVSDRRLDRARAVGAQVAINSRREDVADALAGYTTGEGADITFETVGARATIRQSVVTTRSHGTIVWLGSNERMVPISVESVVTRELTIYGSHGMTDGEFEDALSLLAGGAVPVGLLIKRHAALEEGPALFDELLASPETVKCVFRLSDAAGEDG